MDARRAKVARMRERGTDPFPKTFPGRTSIRALKDRGSNSSSVVRIAGRLVGRHKRARIVFMYLRDSSGELEVLCPRDQFGSEGYDPIADIDIGDMIGIEGAPVRGKRGELTLEARSLTLLGKALMMPPRESPSELHRRSARQELDMIAGGASLDMLRMRTRVSRFMRQWFDAAGFLEVETPSILPHASGASAQPFVTSGNALSADLYLRISIEQSLKRLVIGGLENVYEIGKCFRNEGMSRRHHFEFTMLEWLQGYKDYQQTMDLIEAVVSAAAQEIFGTLRFERRGKTVDLSPPWRRITLREIVKEKIGVDVMSTTRAELARRAGIAGDPDDADWARLVTALYSKQVEPNILLPTFVTDFPREAWPLARGLGDAPELTESFEAVVAGIEIASGATNSNDPDALRQQLAAQRARNDRTPEYDGPLAGLDEAFLGAVSYGMMPMTGAGMGIERVLMLLMGRSSIREVTPIPTLRA